MVGICGESEYLVDLRDTVPQKSLVYTIKPEAIYWDNESEFHFVHPVYECTSLTSIVDCWIVNAKGEIHPGYNCSPVPVSVSNIEFPACYALVEHDEF